MRIPKSYGDYRTELCVFCGQQSFSRNKAGYPVCKTHQQEQGTPDLKCICGLSVEILSGKWGPYARCIQCGNMNMAKIREHNAGLQTKNKVQPPSPAKVAKPAPQPVPDYPILLQPDKVQRIRADQL